MYQIDNQSRIPVYGQIISQIETYILTGGLQPREQLPSVRALSFQLHLNPNTVQRAYSELEYKKLIYSLPGVGSFVADDALERMRRQRREKLAELLPQIREMALSGVDKTELISMIESVYEEEKP